MSKFWYALGDLALLSWAQNAASVLSAEPGSFHITVDQAAEWSARTAAFAQALNAWREPRTRTPIALVCEKRGHY